MSKSQDIAEAVAGLLQASPLLPSGLKVLARKKGQSGNDKAPDIFDAVDAELADMGACIFVFRPVMHQVTQEANFVFVEKAVLTVSIVEKPQLNQTGMDADDLLEAVQLALQWKTLDDLLEHPAMLDNPPISESETDESRVINAFFHLTYQINP